MEKKREFELFGLISERHNKERGFGEFNTHKT